MHASKDLMWWVKEEIFWVGMGKWTHPLFFFFSFCTYGAHPTPFLCLSPRVRVTCYYSMKRWTHGCMHVQSRIRAEKIFFTILYLLLYWIWSISGAIELSACRLGPVAKGSVYVPHVSMHPQKKRNHQAPGQACTAPAANQRILVGPRSTLAVAVFRRQKETKFFT
jgi:hypothetical protein